MLAQIPGRAHTPNPGRKRGTPEPQRTPRPGNRIAGVCAKPRKHSAPEQLHASAHRTPLPHPARTLRLTPPQANSTSGTPAAHLRSARTPEQLSMLLRPQSRRRSSTTATHAARTRPLPSASDHPSSSPMIRPHLTTRHRESPLTPLKRITATRAQHAPLDLSPSRCPALRAACSRPAPALPAHCGSARRRTPPPTPAGQPPPAQAHHGRGP